MNVGDYSTVVAARVAASQTRPDRESSTKASSPLTRRAARRTIVPTRPVDAIATTAKIADGLPRSPGGLNGFNDSNDAERPGANDSADVAVELNSGRERVSKSVRRELGARIDLYC